MRVYLQLLAGLAVCAGAAPACAQGEEGVVVLSDTVTGNQEQPKVLYIVPWQAAEDDTILQQPLTTKLHNEVFEHVEREEHKRELRYLQSLARPAGDKTILD